MIKVLLSFVIMTYISACSTQEKPKSVDWKTASNELARDYALSLGELAPEYVSSMGYTQFDSKVTQFSRTLDDERYVHSYKWQKRVAEILEKEGHPEFKTDARILLEGLILDMEEIEMERSLGVIPFLPMTDYIYGNLQSLMFDGAPKSKQNSAMTRFRTYVRGGEQGLPLADGIKAYMLSKMNALENKRMRGYWPLRKEIEDYLEDSESYLKDIQTLLSKWPGKEWKRDFEELKIQDKEYREFLKKKVLPYSRTNFLTPHKYYSHILKQRGIMTTPEKLISVGHTDYKKTYRLFEELARKLADKYKLKKNDPVSVVTFLKSRRLTTDSEILAAYVKASEELKELVATKKLFTLSPTLDFQIRLATPGEMKSTPSPHYRSIPLVSKTNERAQFVIPTAEGQEGIDDFTFSEAIIDLTAHEAIPGHAVQFHAMRERGVSYIRAWFASNSANTEGWGLYAEEIIYPHVSDEVKFIILQRRLWRMARMFLDPELNFGKIGYQRVEDVFVKELGFSKNWAQVEFDRYSFVYPAQAPSYYYGYKILMETKEKVKKKSDTIFDEKCFNDAVLDLGLLPLHEINTRLLRDLNCVD